MIGTMRMYGHKSQSDAPTGAVMRRQRSQARSKERKRERKTMTDNERVQAIRNELKARGYNSRRVGVTLKYAGYSSVIKCTVKELEIDLKEIEAIANKYKDIDYDERTGEILAGGNTFVRVAYDYRLTA